jgi:pyrimidine-specific ribonucleoside hydrolase
MTRDKIRPIIIDTDPGHDDAIAIMTLMAHPELVKILGITTVAGNQSLELVTKNMLMIAELTKSLVPIVMGASKPLERELETGEHAHGSSGMDGHDLPSPSLLPLEVDYLSFLRETIISSFEKVSIVALGPLTNIAGLLTRYPELGGRIEEISMMGGGLSNGNITPAAEFNFYVDPEAAALVFASGVPITMSGLDVTEKAMIYPRQWEALHHGGAASRFFAQLLDFYNIASRKFGFEGSALHDLCAALWILKPDLFESAYYHVAIETRGELTRGMSLADRRRVPSLPPNARVLLDIDREGLVSYLLESLKRLDDMIAEKS